MALTSVIVAGLLAMGPSNPLGDMPSYWEAMESGDRVERVEAQVADVLTRHALHFVGPRRLGGALPGGMPRITQLHIEGDRASAVVAVNDRTEFVQLVRTNHRWLVVPPERERSDP